MTSSVLDAARTLVATVAVGVFALAIFTPTRASAGDASELVDYLPADSNSVAHIRVDELSKSKYFEQGLEYLEQNSKLDEEVTALFDGEGDVDIRSDVSSLAVGLPVARVRPSSRVERGAFAVSGSFDKEDVETLLNEHFDDVSTRDLDETTVYRVEDTELAVPNSGLLIVAAGPQPYREGVWNVLTDDAPSFDDEADDENLLQGLDTDRSVWMVSRISKSMRGPGSNVETGAIAVNLGSGVDLQIVSHATSDSNAKSMVERLKAMKKTGADNPMLSMFGATPLLENLEIDRSGKIVTAHTSMTESELDTLIGKLKQFTSSRSQLSIPSSTGQKGGDSKTIDSTSGDSKSENSKSDGSSED